MRSRPADKVQDCAEIRALVATSEGLVDDHDPGEVSNLAGSLCGLEGFTMREIEERFRPYMMLKDFHHVRLTNLNRNLPWGGFYTDPPKAFPLADLLAAAHAAAVRPDVTEKGPGVWTEKVALPVKDPGVLELGLRIVARN
ncbi:hypothetical protein [Sphingomonas albertensis]|uniref:Uncharacterized protein n=1 Tax=Sphingomonas albertensis TaxID=2762591 RepID=A0ABR7AJH8_9SPHN|nr:hypothetical protein [Sphingomonas albertensis]MBC3940609.1 hypothetical protein [Sphingomonas albertensis]